MIAARRVAAALAMAVVCQGTFLAAVTSMILALACGMQLGRGQLTGGSAALANLALTLQFPLLHSFLLSARGRPLLQRLSPVGYGRILLVSTYVVVAAGQLLATFWLWSPTGTIWHRPSGLVGGGQWALFALSWLYLGKALADAGLALQTGAAGWWALLRDRSVAYGGLPTAGLFRYCRQPIYLGFALVLWTAPVQTPDWLLLAGVWSFYCVAAPLLKEARWERRFGDAFRVYRAAVPYLLPRFRR